MVYQKQVDDQASAHGIPNSINVVIRPSAPNQTQAILQLKNHFLVVGKALQGVNARTPLEELKRGGPDIMKRTATHLVKFNISWQDALATMETLAASGKLKLDADQRALAFYLLKEACYDVSTSYKAE